MTTENNSGMSPKEQINKALDIGSSQLPRLKGALAKLTADELIEENYKFLTDTLKESIRLNNKEFFEEIFQAIKTVMVKKNDVSILGWAATSRYNSQVKHMLKEAKDLLANEIYTAVFYLTAESGNFLLAVDLLDAYGTKINLDFKQQKMVGFVCPKSGLYRQTSVSMTPITAAALEGHDRIVGLIYDRHPKSGTYTGISDVDERVCKIIDKFQDDEFRLYNKESHIFIPMQLIENERERIAKEQEKTDGVKKEARNLTHQERFRQKMKAKEEARKKAQKAAQEAKKAAEAKKQAEANKPNPAAANLSRFAAKNKKSEANNAAAIKEREDKSTKAYRDRIKL